MEGEVLHWANGGFVSFDCVKQVNRGQSPRRPTMGLRMDHPRCCNYDTSSPLAESISVITAKSDRSEVCHLQSFVSCGVKVLRGQIPRHRIIWLYQQGFKWAKVDSDPPEEESLCRLVELGGLFEDEARDVGLSRNVKKVFWRAKLDRALSQLCHLQGFLSFR